MVDLVEELTEEQNNALFKELETVLFPTAFFEDAIGTLVHRWRLVGKTKSVPWQWVMLSELALTSFCAGTALLVPEEGIKIYALIWAFFLHMGSTNTSGVITDHADILDEIELAANRIFRQRKKKKRRGAEEHEEENDNEEDDGAGMSYHQEGDIEIVQGTGSLEGLGMRAAAP